MINPYYRNMIYRNNYYSPLLRRAAPIQSTRNLSKNLIPQLSRFIETTQRGISTYKQIVPIYKEIKPIILKIGETGKKVINFVNKGNIRSVKENDEIIEEKYNNSTNIKYETGPSSPFFFQK